MITAGNTTQDMVIRSVPNAIVIPQLFLEPPEGYTQYVISQMPKPIPVREGTIPAMILESEGPGIQWGLSIPQILTGALEKEYLQPFLEDEDLALQYLAHEIEGTGDVRYLEGFARRTDLPLKLRWAAKARIYRIQFNSGTPLYIGMLDNPHRYQMFLPVLRYEFHDGEYRYVAGGKSNRLIFAAENHVEALHRAWEWVKEKHEYELEWIKKQAANRDTPRFVADALGIVLNTDDVLYDEQGSRVAWKNGGIHGRFGVMAPDWCYIVKCSPSTAGAIVAMAQQDAKQNAAGTYSPLKINFAGQLHRYFGFTLDDAGTILTCDWGVLRQSTRKPGTWGAFADGTRVPLFEVEIVRERRLIQCRVLDVSERVPKEMEASIVPPNWGMTDTDVVSWGFWYGLERVKRKQAKKAKE